MLTKYSEFTLGDAAGLPVFLTVGKGNADITVYAC